MIAFLQVVNYRLWTMFKSESQKRKLRELVNSKKFKQSVYDALEAATGKSQLPERVERKTKTKKPASKVWLAKVIK